jgi:two-component system response regulator (stage 0 sporulation protein F)
VDVLPAGWNPKERTGLGTLKSGSRGFEIRHQSGANLYQKRKLRLHQLGGMMAKILIVDDQPCVREIYAEELISEGYQVVTARDAESIEGHLRFSRPDLVLLDLYLDGLNGIRVLEDIKRKRPNLPVIIVTAYDSFREDPRLSAAAAYVIKSIFFDELKEKVADVLTKQQVPEKDPLAVPSAVRCGLPCG